MKLYDEIIERKQYLKEENRSPNVGNFRYKKSEELNYILKGVKAYRTDIYNISSIKGRIINLGGGDPLSHKTYKYFRKDVSSLLKTDLLSCYQHTSGNSEIKSTLLSFLSSINLNYNENEMIITASTTHAYSLIMKSILREHDVVLMPTPTYGLFIYEPEKIGGHVEFINLREKNNWKIDLNELKNKIDNINLSLKKKYKNLNYTPRVVALYNQNPNNPLGVFIGEKDKDYLERLIKICKENDILIIDDLVYMNSIYDSTNFPLPMATFEEYKDNVVSLFGVSKAYSLAGVRAGFIVGNKYLIQSIRDEIFLQMDSISLISQLSLASVYDIKRNKYRNKFLNSIKKEYKQNLEVVKYFVYGEKSVSSKVSKKINKVMKRKKIKTNENGMKNVSIYHNLIPESGFFILLDFTALKGYKVKDWIINDDIDLLLALYKYYKIKFLPGSSFAWNNKNEIIGRITFSSSFENLIEDMKHLQDAINSIKERGVL